MTQQAGIKYVQDEFKRELRELLAKWGAQISAEYDDGVLMTASFNASDGLGDTQYIDVDLGSSIGDYRITAAPTARAHDDDYENRHKDIGYQHEKGDGVHD